MWERELKEKYLLKLDFNMITTSLFLLKKETSVIFLQFLGQVGLEIHFSLIIIFNIKRTLEHLDKKKVNKLIKAGDVIQPT